MPKIMIINVTHAEESRVGIVTNNVLTSFEIESFSREHLKGNIYKAIVHRIHPALEAAFVDIGAERDAFLPLDEVCFRNLPNPPPRENGNGGERRRPKINEVLKPGQEILVQIAKEQFATKPPTLSTYFSLAGRYLVLLPGSDESGISRRIEGAERERLRELIGKLEAPPGFGLIVRTVAGFDPGERELQRDLTYLTRLWESIQHSAGTKRGPALIYREHDLVLRNIRDYFTPDIDEVWIDNEEVFQRARDFFRDVMPEREDVLRLYEGDRPIFSHFNVEGQIDSIYKRRVPLKSGGSIVIDGTEALTAVDVNSGRSVRSASQEETAFRTNIEAANEIARQLRLRDLGGLVVLDFIDMRNPAHIQEVERTLRAAMHEDKARHEIGRISQFGLLEISRQRLRPAAAATSYVACQRCDGYGLVRTTESATLVALRKIHLRVAQGDAGAVRVSLPEDVGLYLLNHKREDLAQLERRYAVRIQVVLSDKLMPHQSEFEVRPRLEAENGQQSAQPQMRLGGVTAADPAAEPAAEAVTPAASEVAVVVAAASDSGEVAAAPSDGAVAAPGDVGGTSVAAVNADGTAKRKRRRGRRRGRGKAAAAAIGEALAALGSQVSLTASPMETISESGNEAPRAVMSAAPEAVTVPIGNPVARAAAPGPGAPGERRPVPGPGEGRPANRSRRGRARAAAARRASEANNQGAARADAPPPRAPGANEPRHMQASQPAASQTRSLELSSDAAQTHGRVAEAKPATPKAREVSPSETKPTESRPVATKPVEGKPTKPKASKARPSGGAAKDKTEKPEKAAKSVKSEKAAKAVKPERKPKAAATKTSSRKAASGSPAATKPRAAAVPRPKKTATGAAKPSTKGDGA